MKNEDVRIGSVYEARVTRQTVAVKILGRHPIKGWVGLNLNTNRRIWIKSGRRLTRLLHA